MPNTELFKYIEFQLLKGTDPNQIESALVKRGWDKIEVNRAILDVKMGTQSPQPEIQEEASEDNEPEKEFNKKLWINVGATILLFVFIGIFMLYSPDKNVQEYQLPIDQEQANVEDITQEQPQNQESEDTSWCTAGKEWSDTIIESTESLLITGLIEHSTIICHASSESEPELGYHFTENNEQIWKFEYTEITVPEKGVGLTKIKIKP